MDLESILQDFVPVPQIVIAKFVELCVQNTGSKNILCVFKIRNSLVYLNCVLCKLLTKLCVKTHVQ